LLSINLTKCDSYNIPHDCSYKFTLYIIILNLNIEWWQVHKYIEWAWVFYLKIILNFDWKKNSYQNKNKNLFFTCKYLNLAINNFVLKQMIKI
jgi:hypothetical protein